MINSQTLDLQKFILPKGIHPKIHSNDIDEYMGFNCIEIEQKLSDKCDNFGHERWIGFDPQVIQTPYSEILSAFENLKNYSINRIVDFGAGYGRVGILSSLVFPNSLFLGFENIKERLLEGERIFNNWKINNATILYRDILDNNFDIPEADIYFIYDFSEVSALKFILQKLSVKVHNENFFLIARGVGVRSLIQNKFPEFWSLHKPFSSEIFSIYSTFCDL